MRLTSLRLFGFKTFAEQTTLAFEPGITALVGPNGSGKSNLVDAIRWVLGEQSSKSLRGAKIEDVIFAGNERRKPLGMAEVSVTFANDDGRLRIDANEVQLTRRAYRAGESEFFINRQSVRLRDVVELLMGTGLGPGSYAIVSQGQIDAILAAKPSDRRSLFEETAGINRFLAKKNESLRRLEQTEQNGIRTSDLLRELEARLPELETQARRARRYRKASARARDLEVLSYLRSGASRRHERERLQTELEGLHVAVTGAAAQAAAAENDVARVRTDLYARERALEAQRAEATLARAALAELEAERAAMGARRDALESQSSQFTGDRARADDERRTLLATIERLEAELGPHQAELEEARARDGVAQEAVALARAGLDGVFTELREMEAAAAAAAATEAERRAEVAALRSTYERLEREAFALRAEAQERSERVAGSARELETASETLGAVTARETAARGTAAAADAGVTAAAGALARAEAAYRSATSELASAEARLHTIEELEANLEGHVPGTRAVLEATARGDFGGIIGVVSNLVRVDERYARALDIAFGASLSNIVTDSSESAERAIAYLRSREAGRATFLPLDTLGSRTGRDPREAPREAGVIGYAHELARPTEPRYEGIVAFLVGRILVVETLDVGVRLVRAKGFRDAIVTLDGDEIRGGGAMTGGRYKRERSILSRRAQARTLSEALPRLRADLEAAQGEAEAARATSARVTTERDGAQRALADLAVRARDARSLVERLDSDRARLDAEVASLLDRAAARERETGDARERLALADRAPIDASTAESERERLEAALGVAREQIARAQDSERAVAAQIAQARETVASLIARRDGAHARLGLDRHRRAPCGGSARDGCRPNSIRSARALRTVNSRSRPRAKRSRRSTRRTTRVRDEREGLAGRAQLHEAELRDARATEREASTQSEGARLRLAEIDAELGMLAAQFARHPATADECADIEDVTPTKRATSQPNSRGLGTN